jgi:hypothetical protein
MQHIERFEKPFEKMKKENGGHVSGKTACNILQKIPSDMSMNWKVVLNLVLRYSNFHW